MKKILFISQHLNRAGTEAFMMSVFRGIDHSRFQVDFLVYNQKQTDYSREVEAAGCKVWRVPSRRESPLGWYLSLNRFFREHAKEYAAIHYCGNGLTAIAPILFAAYYGVPVRIVHSHNSSSQGLHNKLLHLLQRGLARRLSTHHFACSSLAAKWFFGKSEAVIIRNGIETRRFAYNEQVRAECRRENGIQEGTVVFGHVGRFCEEKNHAFLIEIFAEFTRRNPDALLMLIGIGPLMEDAREKAERLGISDKVLFMNERPDVNRQLQSMDLFVMPSTFEGQPFVLIEAQCSGLPCLVSDVVNRDICLTENVRFLSLKEPPTAWAAEAERMLNDFHRKDESSTIDRKGYSIHSNINYLEGVYDGQE